jgi:AcrR family transcriptional regulator
MKINREKVIRAALKLLNQEGLEKLTLRRLALELKVQAPTIYWHFQSKEDLLDEMATTVLGEGSAHLIPRQKSAHWKVWAQAFGHGLRATLLAHREGARMVSGTRFTNTTYLETTERIGQHMRANDFSARAAVVLFSTIYNYTLSFVMEEQAVFPVRGKRAPQYALAKRNARLDPKLFPFHRSATPILFDHYDRRYREGLELIIRGASKKRPSAPK